MLGNHRDGPGGSSEKRSTSWTSTARTTFYSNSARTREDPRPKIEQEDLVEAVRRLETTKTQSRHARERSEEQLLAETRRLLLFEASGPLESHRAVLRAERGLEGRGRNSCSLLAGSRYWDPDLYLSFRKRFLETGRFGAAAGLQAVVAEATSAALNQGTYGLPPVCAGAEPMKAHLDVFSGAHWVGLESLTGKEKSATLVQVPPLVCSPLGPLEVLLKLKAIFPHHFFNVSFEATDFQDDKEGGGILSSREARSVAQQDMLLRTSLGNNFNAAARLCIDGKTSRGMLQASTDPCLFQAPKVVLFRGPADQGYPFLPEDDQVLVNVLVIGRPNVRPMLSAHGEYFGMQKDVVSHMERLQLLAQVGSDRDSRQRESSINPRLAKVRKPVLVIAAHDLTVHGAPQPRKSIAIALKSWRQYYSNLFEAVVVACGDEQTAQLMDMNINRDIYASALAGATTFCDWCWNERLLELSVHDVLLCISEARKEFLLEKQFQRQRSSGSTGSKERRLETHAESADESAQAAPTSALQNSATSRSETAVAPLSSRDTRRRPSGVTGPAAHSQLLDDSVAEEKWAEEQWRGESSRSAFQRALEIRKAERIVIDPIEAARMRLEYQKPSSEKTANARVIATRALRTFNNHKTRLEKEQKTRFDIDQRAMMYGYPKDLKNHVARLAEIELMDGIWQASHGTSFRSASEVPKLDPEALAGDIGKQLEQSRGNTAGMSANSPAGAPRSPRRNVAKIGRNMQLAGRGVIQNLIEQHEALGSAYS